MQEITDQTFPCIYAATHGLWKLFKQFMEEHTDEEINAIVARYREHCADGSSDTEIPT